MLSDQYEPVMEVLFPLLVSGWERYVRASLGHLVVDPQKEPVLGQNHTEAKKTGGLHKTGIPYDMGRSLGSPDPYVFLLCEVIKMVSVLSVKPTGSQNVP